MQKIINQHEDGTWYFWDETWSIEYGPYNTEELAKKVLEEYCRENELEL